MGKPAVGRERGVDTYNQHITRGFSDGCACGGEMWTLMIIVNTTYASACAQAIFS